MSNAIKKPRSHLRRTLVIGAALVVGVTACTRPTPVTTALLDASLVCWESSTSGLPGEIRFRDATEELGLLDPLTGIHGHAAAIADFNGDGHADIFVGTFGDRSAEVYAFRGATGPKPDQLLVSSPSLQPVPDWSSDLLRTSGALFADLDGDEDEDLVVVRHGGIGGDKDGATVVYENRSGTLAIAAELIGPGFRGRTPTTGDFNQDGLLDLYVSEGRYGETGGLLLINGGGLSFSDQTEGSGLEELFSLGAQAADVNSDSIPDLILSTGVYVNQGDLTFVDFTPPGYVADQPGPDDDPAGVAVGDLNNDGRPDIVVGQHFRSVIETGVTAPLRVFLGRGEGTDVSFVDITPLAGIPPLQTLAPNVEIADVNNDGMADIVTSGSADDGQSLAMFVNLGGDVPMFDPVGTEGSAQYWVGGPVTDLNRDGRLDVVAVEWEPSLPTIGFLNETEAGHWLEISLGLPGMGVGSTVTVLAVDGSLIGRREVLVTTGYASSVSAKAHFGLGEHKSVEVVIDLPGGEQLTLERVGADAHIRWPAGCKSR